MRTNYALTAAALPHKTPIETAQGRATNEEMSRHARLL
jgi:hypothetical protein